MEQVELGGGFLKQATTVERLLLLSHLLAAVATAIGAVAHALKLAESGQLSAARIATHDSASSGSSSSARSAAARYFDL